MQIAGKKSHPQSKRRDHPKKVRQEKKQIQTEEGKNLNFRRGGRKKGREKKSPTLDFSEKSLKGQVRQKQVAVG